jgi:hypothetical protein
MKITAIKPFPVWVGHRNQLVVKFVLIFCRIKKSKHILSRQTKAFTVWEKQGCQGENSP